MVFMVTSWNLLFYLTEVFCCFFTCWCQRTSWQHLKWSRAHLALVFSSEGFNEVFDTERFPHEDGDSLEDNEICWKTKNPQRSEQTEGVSPCPCEECRAPRWAARRSNLTWSREDVMRFLCTCITAWRCSPTLSHQTAATLLMSCGDILICSLRYSEAITGASLTHVPERQDYRIKRALRYQPTNT